MPSSPDSREEVSPERYNAGAFGATFLLRRNLRLMGEA